MNKQKIVDLLKIKDFRKFTGPPEHWLTTFNTKFWGLETKYRRKWTEIDEGDVFVFHSTGIEYLKQKPRLPTGIIGIGIVGGTHSKTNPEWLGEYQGANEWPLLIDFSEIWWFGDRTKILDEPIKEKEKRGEAYILDDLKNLIANCVTFEEMRRNDCVIPAQGSIRNISDRSRERLVGLFADRLTSAVVGNPPGEQERREISEIRNEGDILNAAIRSARNLRDFNIDESDEAAQHRQLSWITYERNAEAQERANATHRRTLMALVKYLRERGIGPTESVIDLFAERENQIFIFEVKSIHADNFRQQTRMALGQLLDYEYFQVRSRQRYQDKIVHKGVVYSREPPNRVVSFLKSAGFEVFWIEDGMLAGDEGSREVLSKFVANH